MNPRCYHYSGTEEGGVIDAFGVLLESGEEDSQPMAVESEF